MLEKCCLACSWRAVEQNRVALSFASLQVGNNCANEGLFLIAATEKQRRFPISLVNVGLNSLRIERAHAGILAQPHWKLHDRGGLIGATRLASS